MSIQSTSAAALHVLELLTGRTNWTMYYAGADTFVFTHGGWTKRLRITGQILSTVETDPQYFVRTVAGQLEGLDYVDGKANSVPKVINILAVEENEKAEAQLAEVEAELTEATVEQLSAAVAERGYPEPTEAEPDPLGDWFRKIGFGMRSADYEEGIQVLEAQAEQLRQLRSASARLATENRQLFTRVENLMAERKRVMGERDAAYAELTALQKRLTESAQEKVELRAEAERLTAEETEELVRLRGQVEHLIEIANVRGEELKHLRARLTEAEANATELAPAPTAEEYITEMRRAESVELVSAMTAGAGFELIRDINGETAMWVQHLLTRPGVQIFLQVTHQQLVELSPAELYVLIRDQVGAA